MISLVHRLLYFFLELVSPVSSVKCNNFKKYDNLYDLPLSLDSILVL